MDEIEYLLKFKDLILDPEEKALFIREDEKSEEVQIAKGLCKKGSDLKNVKIHEFRKYMKNEIILDYCAQRLYDQTLELS